MLSALQMTKAPDGMPPALESSTGHQSADVATPETNVRASQARSVRRLQTLDLDRTAVNRASDCDFLADVPFDLRSIVDFQHLVIHDEDGSRAALYALRGAVLMLRARAFCPALRVGDPTGKVVGHGGNRK